MNTCFNNIYIAFILIVSYPMKRNINKKTKKSVKQMFSPDEFGAI